MPSPCSTSARRWGRSSLSSLDRRCFAPAHAAVRRAHLRLRRHAGEQPGSTARGAGRRARRASNRGGADLARRTTRHPGAPARQRGRQLARADGGCRRRPRGATGLHLDEIARVREIERVASVARAHAGRAPVASSGQRAVVGATLAALDLADLFDAIVTIEDVRRPKPAPDLYLLAADRLGVEPAGCIANEDTDVGAQSARAAGMRVIDVRRRSVPSGPCRGSARAERDPCCPERALHHRRRDAVHRDAGRASVSMRFTNPSPGVPDVRTRPPRNMQASFAVAVSRRSDLMRASSRPRRKDRRNPRNRGCRTSLVGLDRQRQAVIAGRHR